MQTSQGNNVTNQVTNAATNDIEMIPVTAGQTLQQDQNVNSQPRSTSPSPSNHSASIAPRPGSVVSNQNHNLPTSPLSPSPSPSLSNHSTAASIAVRPGSPTASNPISNSPDSPITPTTVTGPTAQGNPSNRQSTLHGQIQPSIASSAIHKGNHEWLPVIRRAVVDYVAVIGAVVIYVTTLGVTFTVGYRHTLLGSVSYPVGVFILNLLSKFGDICFAGAIITVVQKLHWGRLSKGVMSLPLILASSPLTGFYGLLIIITHSGLSWMNCRTWASLR
jgi:hypothetical protein